MVSSSTRRTARAIASALLAAGVFLQGCASLPGEGIEESANGRHAYALAGEGGPIVVFESGLPDGRDAWRGVFEPVSAFTRALACDRAGLGRSRSDAAERDAATIVGELRALLQALELAPPYVLVAHSIGGQYVEYFARTHPAEIAGGVFVDARHNDFSDRCIAEAVERCEVPWLARVLMPSGAVGELDAQGRSEAQIRAAGPFPDVPVRVLTATRRPESMPNLRRVWAETQSELAELSPQGVQEICEGCGHYIQRERPELVVDAIRTVVDQVRGIGR